MAGILREANLFRNSHEGFEKVRDAEKGYNGMSYFRIIVEATSYQLPRRLALLLIPDEKLTPFIVKKRFK